MARSWYILHTFTGYENKIEKQIRQLLEAKEIDPEVLTDVKLPLETVKETKTLKDGKQSVKEKKVNFMPGYMLLEMDIGFESASWRPVCNKLRRIQGVTGFVGTNPNERPRAISEAEAKTMLQKMGVIKGGKPARVAQSFDVNDRVKITDGPFATFSGVIKEMMAEKEMLKVEVEIFGRPTPVELSFAQVEKEIK